MKTVNVSELECVALDWAVAHAVESWKTAHELFPTWTLDATFAGVRPMVYSDGQAFCQLVPNNPMRQDPQKYSPSTDWSQCGPLISSEYVDVWHSLLGTVHDVVWCGQAPCGKIYRAKTPLIAACRAIVAAKMGDTVDVPEELL